MKLTEPRFIFGTKAGTLSRLSGALSLSNILPTYYFNVLEWKENPSKILQETMTFAKRQSLIIRSSAQNEDGSASSMAGAFESCLNVACDEVSQIQQAIERVIHSYNPQCCNEDQVLVQPMLQDVDICGVIMTHDLELGAPYYVVNYDDESGLTDTITGGTGIQKTVLIYRNVELNLIRSKRLRKVIEATQELEKYCGDLPLDIEFAQNKSGQLYILQVRRISLSNTWHPVTERRVARKLEYVRDFIALRNKQRPGVYGNNTLLGVMPDWNPAEMIGTTPSPLATSLYRLLITKDVWRLARQKMGYYHPENEELMTIIDHHPYIDVRNSFNSFLPAKLSSGVKHKLVNAWIERLTLCPELHDKVEFTVAQTCVDFTFDIDFKERYQGVLSDLEYEEFRSQLWQLTKDCLNSSSAEGSLAAAIAMIDKLEKHHTSQKTTRHNDHLSQAEQLLYECRRLGTMGFSIIARHAFIAESFLYSAAKLKVLSSDRIQAFKSSLHTVTSNLTSDYEAVCSGTLPASEYLAQFGHLRPGTYDITSLRYDERIDLFNASSGSPTSHRGTTKFKLTLEEKTGLESLLQKNHFGISAEQLMQYARSAIINREHGKFVFTKSLSDALKHLSLWGSSIGLAKEDVANLEIDSLLNLTVSPVLDDLDRLLLNTAVKSGQSVDSSRSLKLSHLITSIDDVYVVPLHRSMPNFITQAKVEGPIILLRQDTPATLNLSGFIVCIENADPGYDWIFTKDIVGLVTQFGGANSHMAIRCAEFSIAAAIGCGEQVFNRIISKGQVVLNCAEKTLKSI
jgi:hypothetical protein